MKIDFHKYQAAGNDFILLDNRSGNFPLQPKLIAEFCDRRFGIGADGLILLENDDNQAFKVVYFNPDGSQSLCGNGCRAALRFAETLELANGAVNFEAHDGVHNAKIDGETIQLGMANVQNGRQIEDGIFLDTGSPHYVLFVDDLDNTDVLGIGRKWRYSGHFSEGANVNFVQINGPNELSVRTYERGVENETLSCGTGVTAAALAASLHGVKSPVKIHARGGTLSVAFEATADMFINIVLEGPAEHVFSGEIEV